MLLRDSSVISSRGKYDRVDDTIRKAIALALCPLNNLIGESSFGDFDFDLSNASLHNRSAVHMIKRNRTMKFLNKKTTSQQKSILAIAWKYREKYRRNNTQLEQKATDQIRQRFVEKQDKKIQKELASLTKNANIVEAVHENGGPCKSSQDVDELVMKLEGENKTKKSITDAIKDQIRYQKLISKKRLKFGTLEFMINTLKQSF